VKPERLVYIHGSEDENEPGQFERTVTFVAKGEKTELTMRAVFKTKEELDYVIENHRAREGGQQTINRLEEYLARLI
jgi:uncharacterized protein YndB with AHSA1/START domain